MVFIKSGNNFTKTGNKRGDKPYGSLLTDNNENLTPSFSKILLSRSLLLPTNFISILPKLILSVFASAIAGNICPPEPPAAIKILIGIARRI